MERRTVTMSVTAHKILSASLRKAHYWPNPPSGHLGRFNADAEARLLARYLDTVGFEIVRKPEPGASAEERVEYARRTGNWDGVSDKDYRTWLASLQQTIVPPGAGIAGVTERPLDSNDGGEPVRQFYYVHVGWPDFHSEVLLLPERSDVATVTKAAKDAAAVHKGMQHRDRWPAFSWEEDRFLAPDEPAPTKFIVGPSQALIERQGGKGGYHAALETLRKPRPSVAEVAKALGRGSPNGSEGNVWSLLDDRLQTVATGREFDVTYGDKTGRTFNVGHAERIALEPSRVAELPPGREVRWPGLDANTAAVRDLVLAHAMIERAALVLGGDACTEIMNNLADPSESEAA